MGDRIHEQHSMNPPRCSGRRKNPGRGLYSNVTKLWSSPEMFVPVIVGKNRNGVCVSYLFVKYTVFGRYRTAKIWR
jgi:hypothetical protein